MEPNMINVDEITPTAKDVERAEGLRWQRNTFHGDNSPFRGQAAKMAKLIRDPKKLVRRAKAVYNLYGCNDYFGDLPPGQWIDPEWKATKDAWRPFANALKKMGFSWTQIRSICNR